MCIFRLIIQHVHYILNMNVMHVCSSTRLLSHGKCHNTKRSITGQWWKSFISNVQFILKPMQDTVCVLTCIYTVHFCLQCICMPACEVFLKVINAYCPKDLCEIAVRWERFSLACRLNIGFSKKSIKGLIIKVNKYSLPSKPFQDLQFPITTVALLLFTILCWHTQTHCT